MTARSAKPAVTTQYGRAMSLRAPLVAAIVAFIIYTMTLGKIREIAVLKLIGTRNRTIAGMILQQALALGLIGFIVGKTAAELAAEARNLGADGVIGIALYPDHGADQQTLVRNAKLAARAALLLAPEHKAVRVQYADPAARSQADWRAANPERKRGELWMGPALHHKTDGGTETEEDK